MSVSSFVKYLREAKDLDKDLPTRKRVAAILSDSKANYIKSYATSNVDSGIVWWSTKGLTTEIAFNWLYEKIDSKLRKYGEISIYIWLGTCDLTKKNKYVSLNVSYEADLTKTIENYRKLSDYARSRNLKLIFLEVPYFSITEYNRFLGHKDPETFRDQDCHLKRAIESLNVEIHRLNKGNGTCVPRFCIDLIRSRGSRGRKPRYYENYNVYKDGVHPKPILGRYWMRKITELVRRDCY